MIGVNMELELLTDSLIKSLTKRIMSVPQSFYSTFEYTSRGNNLTHPFTLEFIVDSLRELKYSDYIGIDVRLNDKNGTKFQPDIVGYTKNFYENIYIDYESPNSSDARIVIKDVLAYLAWTKATKSTAPYIIITTLPEIESRDWKLLYKYGYNKGLYDNNEAVKNNPYLFWYNYYYKELEKHEHKNIVLININGNNISRKYLK